MPRRDDAKSREELLREVAELRTRLGATESRETDRRRTKLEVDVLGRALRSIGEAVAISDMDDSFLFVNQAFLDLYGYEESDLVSKPWAAVRSAGMPEAQTREMLRAVLAAGRWEGEITTRRKDGVEFPTSLVTSIVRDERGWPVAQISVVKDITAQKRSEEALVRHDAYLAALHEIALGLMSRHSLNDLFEAVIRRAAALVGTEHGYIYILEPGGHSMQMRVAIGVIEPHVGYRIKPGEGAGGQVWRTGQPVIVSDYSQWEGRLGWMEQGVVHATLAVPLTSGDQITGVIGLAFVDPKRHLGSEEIALLSQFAQLASIALDNARLFETEREARGHAETLQAATQALSGTLDLQRVFDLILTELHKVVPHSSASVQELQGDRLKIIGGHGFANLRELIGVTFDIHGDNPNRLVIESQAPVILADASEAYASFRTELHSKTAVHSWLGVPLLFGDRITGMITVESHEAGFYTEKHARLASAFAAQAAIAIENARLYTAAREELAAKRRAEAERETSLALLRATFEATEDGILAVDPEGHAVTFNKKLLDLFGLPEAALAPDAASPVLDVLAAALRDPESFLQKAHDLARQPDAESHALVELKDGRTFERFSQPQRMGDAIAGRVWSFRDVTAPLRAEKELKEAKEAAEAGSRAKSAFLANMSHELRTPLNAIIGYAEMLEESFGSEKNGELLGDLNRIHAAGKHLLAIINDVLDLSKIEVGKMELAREKVPIAVMVEEVITTLHPLLERNTNTLEVRLPDEPGVLVADRVRLKQVLFNLLSNASKFTQHGHISLRVTRECENGTEWVRFRVADTGIGIAAEELRRLFQAFTQADASTSRRYGGTGLGLVISRRLCQLMGGDITVVSEPGRGSAFTAYLPGEGSEPV